MADSGTEAAERRRRRACSCGDDVKLSGVGRFTPVGNKGSGRCAVHTFVHDDRFAFDYLNLKGNAQISWSKLKPWNKAHALGGS